MCGSCACRCASTEERQGVPRAEHRRFLGAGAEGNPQLGGGLTSCHVLPAADSGGCWARASKRLFRSLRCPGLQPRADHGRELRGQRALCLKDDGAGQAHLQEVVARHVPAATCRSAVGRFGGRNVPKSAVINN
ncbi:MAG: hypothetical protein ACLTMP_13185 [Eggerthella lenta]